MNIQGATVQGDETVTVLTIRGSWDEALHAEIRAALRECFSTHPSGLIIDLSALHDLEALSVPVWMNARHVGVDIRPPVAVALCVPPESHLADRLQRLRSHHHLPVYAQVRQARVALDGLISRGGRLVLHLDPEPEAPAEARRLADQACRAWHVSHLAFPVRLVTSELVSNAVRHARTAITVILSRRDDGVHLIVADGDQRLPSLPGPPDMYGLQIVEAVSAEWGVAPTLSGKLVWALVSKQPVSAAR